MFKLFIFSVLTFFIFLGCATIPSSPELKKIYNMNPEEITVILNKQSGPLHEKIYQLLELSLDTQYMDGPLGEGEDAFYDKDPLIDLKHVDCMTFVEQITTLAVSKNYEEAYAILQRVRYKEGFISFKTRNHYAVTDWLPANAWLISDETARIAEDKKAVMEKIINRAEFFKNKGFPELSSGEVEALFRTDFIPKKFAEDVVRRIPEGSIIIFVWDRPGIFAKHMGFFYNGMLYHASSYSKKVLKEDFLEYLKSSESTTGFKVCVIMK